MSSALLRHQLEASIALTDAPRLPHAKGQHESWFEYRRRCDYEAGRFRWEHEDEWLARKGRTGGLQESEADALLATYRNARSDWMILFLMSRGWPGINSDQHDQMEGHFERAVELRNMIYGTEY